MDNKLETAQKIGQKTTESFEKMNNKEKKEGFTSLIEKLEENSSINRIKDKRNSMTEEQKSKLYKRNAITVSEFLKRGSPLYQIYTAIVNGVKNTKNNGGKNALKYAFLEQIPCRFFVELGIFDKPEGLTEEKLVDDIKKDAKNFNIYLGICETICKIIPEAKAAVPFIGIAKLYTKWYKDHGTEAVIARLNQKKESEIKHQTIQELANTMNDSKGYLTKAA